MVMKNCVILLVAMFMVNIANAQLVEGKKVCVDKKTFYGVEIASTGVYNYKGGKYVSFDDGSGASLRFFINAPINKNPESKWSGLLGLGLLNIASSSQDPFQQITTKQTDINKTFKVLQICPIDFRFIYKLKDCGTTGRKKLYVFPGLDICPLTVFNVSLVYTPSNDPQADTNNKFGISIGAFGGVGYRISKWDFNLMLKYELLTPYSQGHREHYSEPKSVHYISAGLGIGYIF